jgi:DNA polymerase III epsilon subunit-like protein
MKHIMVDLETLGTVADSCILSIGAVKFDLDSDVVDDAGFYASVSIDSNLEARRRIQEDTLIWWMKQGTAAQTVFHEPKVTLEDALVQFSDWIGSSEYSIWSNGADFDIPMLAHAYRSLSIEIPWLFWNSNCFRTYKKLPGAKGVVAPPVGTKHNALADAYNQARTLQMIQAKLFGKPSKVKA